MKFDQVATNGADALSASFYANAVDKSLLKPGAVAIMKQSLRTSNGFDGPSTAPTFGL